MDFSLIPMDCIEIESQSPSKYSIKLMGQDGPLTFKMSNVHLPYGITRNKKGKAVVPIRFEDEKKYHKNKQFFERLDQHIAKRFESSKYLTMLSLDVIHPLVSTNSKGQSNMILKDKYDERVTAMDLPYNCTADVTLQVPFIWYLKASQTKDMKQDITGAFFVIKEINNFFSKGSNNLF